jgi:anti-anti-sigma regulatory factor
MTIAPTAQLKVWTEKTLDVFDEIETPLWVFDFESMLKWWANRSGLRLWSSPGNAELRERGRASSAMSEATRIRLLTLRSQLVRGEVLNERWNFYPSGHPPFVADVLLSGIEIVFAADTSSRIAMLVEARRVGADEVDTFALRGVEALRHLSELVSLFKPNGELLMRNPAAILVLGDELNVPSGTDSFVALFASSTDALSIRASIESGPVRGTFELVTKDGLAWHALNARKVVDPVTGEIALLVNHSDVSDRIRAQHALTESREVLEIQTEQLRRLAASPLRVWKGILALPLIGRIDEARIRAGLEGIQARSAREQIKVVLLDLTGVEGVDIDAAESIRRLIRSLALQGIGSRVVGVRATLARTLVGEGIDLGTVPLHASLADALGAELRA